jgi:hypothetical protein
MGRPLLLDIACLCDEHSDAALEGIYKAIGEEPPDGDIWAEHPNPFVRRIVELFTQRGLDRIQGLRAELTRWLRGEEHQSTPEAPTLRPDGAMRRWDATELGVVRLYLRNLPAGEFAIDDWMLLVDYLVQRYLPEADLRSEADWLATRSGLMGRVQAAMGEAKPEQVDVILATLPSLEDAIASWGMTAPQRAAIDYGRARCAESVTGLADSTRHRLRRMVVDHQEAIHLGDRAAAAHDIQTKLLDEFGLLSRDWRRIAVTEATENTNQGFIASMPPGARVRRVEKYRGACPFCRSIDGKVVTVVSPTAPDKDGETQIWVGKTNVGRSASPRKRAGGALVEREPHEMWWVAAGAMHPHCRGAWVKAGGASADPEFEAFLENLGKRKST